MTFLRYFLPLIIEANKKKIKSKVLIKRNAKYNNPYSFLDLLNNLSQEHNFDILDISEARNCTGISFVIEGVDCRLLDRDKTKIISITYMTDYFGLYDGYIEHVDNVIFPSKYFANQYDKINSKNLYLGSPKYDINLNKENIIKKYNLTNNKKALIIYPRTRDLNKVDIKKIISFLKLNNYDVVVKSRGKEPINNVAHSGDFYFLDKSWVPHTTIELIEVSDIIINFNSTCVKECVILKKPLINFNIKPWLPLPKLYNHSFCESLNTDCSQQEFTNSIKRLTESNLEESFNNVISNYLFEGNSSRRILKHFRII